MLALDVLFHVLELAATFAVGAWTGSRHCSFAIAVSTDELRRSSWVDELGGCWARARWRRAVTEPPR